MGVPVKKTPCTYKRYFNRKCNFKNTEFLRSSSVRQKIQRKKGSPSKIPKKKGHTGWSIRPELTGWLPKGIKPAPNDGRRRVPLKLGPVGPSKLWVNDDRAVGITLLSESENWQLWSHNIGGCWYHLVIVIRKLKTSKPQYWWPIWMMRSGCLVATSLPLTCFLHSGICCLTIIFVEWIITFVF